MMFIEPSESSPHLLADVGGTNVRFALDDGAAGRDDVTVLATRDFPSLIAAVRHYLAGRGAQGRGVRRGAIGIANPVWGDQIRMTNHDWSFSIETMRRELAWDAFVVLNDFAAMAYALPSLAGVDLLRVGGTVGEPNAPRVLLGPGTGLGVSSLVASPAGPVAVPGEGGHVSFAPETEREIRLWHFMHSRFPRVSCERLLCGSGLSYLHAFISGVPLASSLGEGDLLAPEAITAAALSGTDRASCETLDLFCGLLGALAGDLALALGARGGVFIGGGIVPCLGGRLAQSPLRTRFEAKGRMSDYLHDIPIDVILSPYATLAGLSVASRQSY